MIDFNIPPYTGRELEYMRQAAESKKICGDGMFTKRCDEWLERRFGCQKVLLTQSGTAALEMSAFLCNLQPGDEVILPSFTFSSTANAFVLVGARLRFVDVDPATMNIDPEAIERAITSKTRAICVMHYGGIACDMDAIMGIAREHDLKVVEDAAQGVMATYHGKALGTIGDFGCFSFHETKNYSMGEGGALLINDPTANDAAEILREKGTDRARFFRGQVDKYTWMDYGSSYLPSDLNAAYLWAQLEQADVINDNRLAIWQRYHDAFAPLAQRGLVRIPTVPEGCIHNAHLFYLKFADLAERTAFIAFMREAGVRCVFHYIPLHSSPAGERFGEFVGEDAHTTSGSEQLARLPFYYGLSQEDQTTVIEAATAFITGAGTDPNR
jgi:dTDP-4-amino-4,6-dideoxygalactose transaminase